MDGAKRKRSNLSSKVKRAIAINARINKAYPYSTYGRAYYQRGTPENLARFGATYKLADAAQRAARKAAGYVGRGRYMRRYTGQGGFWDDVWGGVKSAVSDVWGGIKQPLIDTAGGMIRRIGGRGAYTLNYNQLVNPRSGDPNVMKMVSHNDETGALVITHREYIVDISGSTSFQNHIWACNPTNNILFPYLSQLASNFEEYEFKQLVFEYKPVITDSSSGSNQIGTVILVFDYNGAGELLTTKQQMMQYDGAISAKASDGAVLGVECDRNKHAGLSNLFVPPYGQTPIGEDPKTYNKGMLQVAVNQTQGNQQIGELYVYYTIKLAKPKFASALGTDLPYMSLSVPSTGTGTMFSLVGSALPQSNINNQQILGSNNCNLVCNVSDSRFSIQEYSTTYANLAAVLAAARLADLNATGTYNVWGVTHCVFGGARHLIFRFPDNLGVGTFRLDFTTETTNAYSPVIGGNSANVNVKFKAAPFLPTGSSKCPKLVVTINSSAVNNAIAGPSGTGSYVQLTFDSSGATFSGSSFISVDQVNPNTTA